MVIEERIATLEENQRADIKEVAKLRGEVKRLKDILQTFLDGEPKRNEEFEVLKSYLISIEKLYKAWFVEKDRQEKKPLNQWRVSKNSIKKIRR